MLIKFIRTVIFLLLAFVPGFNAAVAAVQNQANLMSARDAALVQKDSNLFDAAKANLLLSQISSRLTQEHLDLTELQTAAGTLTDLQIQANKCVDQSTSQLSTLNEQLSESKIINQSKGPLTTEQQYLQNKISESTKQLSACRLFVIRSTEVINASNAAAQKLAASELFHPSTHAFKNLAKLPVFLQEGYSAFDSHMFLYKSGIQQFTLITFISFVLFASIGLFSGLKLRALFSQRLRALEETKNVTLFKRAVLGVLRRYTPLLVTLILLDILSAVFDIIYANQWSYLTLILSCITIYYFFSLLIRFFVYSPTPMKAMMNLPQHLAKALAFRLRLLGLLAVIALVFYICIYKQELPSQLIALAKTVFITLSAINLIAVMWIANRLPKLIYQHRSIHFLFTSLLSIGLIIILTAQWLGYDVLAMYLLRGITLTLVLAFILWLAYKITQFLLGGFVGAGMQWQQSVKHYLGIKPDEKLAELLGLRVLIYILLWMSFFLGLLKAWGLGQANFKLLVHALLHGFEVANINVVPSRIFLAAFMLVILFIIVRLLRSRIAQHSMLEIESGARESLAAIFGYVGFALALLFALLIAGVSFSGLAIIAGALSVGIGFGLQNIVNNFVSGIILLIERPIRPGDRIIVGDTEGYVRKVSIRSTQIRTLTRADVIVPNSELITKQVTNLMFHDDHAQISISIGVAYGSDTELVKKLLLETAYSHEGIITNIEGQCPQVYFKHFGDSSLNFVLSCAIGDVNQKDMIISDLNFAIEKIFCKHHIEIPYPHQEIIIKEVSGGAKFTTS